MQVIDRSSGDARRASDADHIPFLDALKNLPARSARCMRVMDGSSESDEAKQPPRKHGGEESIWSLEASPSDLPFLTGKPQSPSSHGKCGFLKIVTSGSLHILSSCHCHWQQRVIHSPMFRSKATDLSRVSFHFLWLISTRDEIQNANHSDKSKLNLNALQNNSDRNYCSPSMPPSVLSVHAYVTDPESNWSDPAARFCLTRNIIRTDQVSYTDYVYKEADLGLFINCKRRKGCVLQKKKCFQLSVTHVLDAQASVVQDILMYPSIGLMIGMHITKMDTLHDLLPRRDLDL